jgi:hypothetical protein
VDVTAHATLDVAIEELVLDGVSLDDPVVALALERAVGPALQEHGLGGQAAQVAGAVVGAVNRELGG